MQPGVIEGATRILGKSQGYMGLPVRDGETHCKVGGPGTPVMTTAWFPTPKELEAINAGAPIHVMIVGTSHPPMIVEVGNVPDV